MERRVAAVLAADMVGYSRLIERDELGTLERQKGHLRALIRPAIAERHGRIVKLTGDGLIAEFTSVVEAVQCALAIQEAMVTREADQPEAERIVYRVAIHLGDLVFDEGDVYGDGVNIAARLEALAVPGGVVVSGTAYDVLKANVEVAYQYLGEKHLKNIATPVRVYQVVAGLPDAPPPLTRRRTPRLAAALMLLLLLGAGFWWQQRPDFAPLDPAALAYPLPSKPSLAVLPFENLSPRADDQYMADGFVDTLITELMSLHDLVVIAKNSSFSFRDEPVLTAEIAERLGVRYLLEGSFQRQEESLRINARLMDAVEGRQVWSGRYDRDVASFTALQDELIRDLVLEIGGRAGGGLFRAERERVSRIPNDQLAILELWEKATGIYLQFTDEGQAEVKRLSDEMIARFPDHPRGYLSLAWFHLGKAWAGHKHDHAEVVRHCTELTEHAISLSPNDYMAYMARAYCSSRAGDAEGASAWAQRSFNLNRGDILVQRDYARFVLTPRGDFDKSIEILERNQRLNPTQQANLNASLGELYAIMGRYDEALEQLEKEAVRSAFTEARTAVALYFTGRIGAATQKIAALRERSPDYSIESFLRSLNWVPAEAQERFARALRASGLPDFPPVQPEEFAFALPEVPSIVVLPFDYLGPEKDDDSYLADGLSENVTANLAKLPGLLVIARNSAFVYKGRAVDVRQIARELGVQYILEGSLSRSGDSLRITAQLIDAVAGNHILAETYDVALEDYFAVLDRITLAILSQIYQGTVTGPKIRPVQTHNLKAFIEVVRGWDAIQPFTPDALLEARQRFQAAAGLDAGYARALAGIGFTHLMTVRLGYAEDGPEALELAQTYLDRARRLDPQDGMVEGDRAILALLRGEGEEARRLAMRANSLNPGDSSVSYRVAWVLRNLGQSEQSVLHHRKAKRMKVHRRWDEIMDELVAQIDAGNYEAAADLTETFLGAAPEMWRAAFMAYPAMVQWQLGNEAAARDWIARAKRGWPEISIAALGAFDIPYLDRSLPERRYAVWRKLGLPEHPPGAAGAEGLTLPEKPSIIVLPFDNFSGDPALDYIGEGLASEIIAGLGQHPKLFVIARRSSFSYRGQGATFQSIARERGVRYVLEGGFQLADGGLRVTVHLIDALSEKHLWSKVYQHDLSVEGLFAINESILQKVLVALDQKLIYRRAADAFRQAGDLETYSLLGQAIAEFQKFTPESNFAARQLAEAALERRPDSPGAHTTLAWIAWYEVMMGNDPAAQMRLARDHAEAALELEPASPDPHSVLAWLELLAGDHAAARAHADKALALYPGGGGTAALTGWVYAAVGEPVRGIELIRLAMRTEPVYPTWVAASLALSLMITGQYEQAEATLRKVHERDGNPLYAGALAVALVQQGDHAEAQRIVSDLRAAQPQALLADYTRHIAYLRDAEFRNQYAAALASAGMPEALEEGD